MLAILLRRLMSRPLNVIVTGRHRILGQMGKRFLVLRIPTLLKTRCKQEQIVGRGRRPLLRQDIDGFQGFLDSEMSMEER